MAKIFGYIPELLSLRMGTGQFPRFLRHQAQGIGLETRCEMTATYMSKPVYNVHLNAVAAAIELRGAPDHTLLF
jgi:hypothetical protein